MMNMFVFTNFNPRNQKFSRKTECTDFRPWCPTICSWYHSTSRTSSGSFPTRKVTFHVPRSSLQSQGSAWPGSPLLIWPAPNLDTSPCEWWAQRVAAPCSLFLGYAWLGPMGQDPATDELPILGLAPGECPSFPCLCEVTLLKRVHFIKGQLYHS